MPIMPIISRLVRSRSDIVRDCGVDLNHFMSIPQQSQPRMTRLTVGDASLENSYLITQLVLAVLNNRHQYFLLCQKNVRDIPLQVALRRPYPRVASSPTRDLPQAVQSDPRHLHKPPAPPRAHTHVHSHAPPIRSRAAVPVPGCQPGPVHVFVIHRSVGLTDSCSPHATTGLDRRVAATVTQYSLELRNQEWSTFIEAWYVKHRHTIRTSRVGISHFANGNFRES
jgi:hypothetical protein